MSQDPETSPFKTGVDLIICGCLISWIGDSHQNPPTRTSELTGYAGPGLCITGAVCLIISVVKLAIEQ